MAGLSRCERRSVHGGRCALRLHAPSAPLIRVCLRQISNHTVRNLITIQQALLRATPGRAGCRLPRPLGRPSGPVWRDLTAHHRGATTNQVKRYASWTIHPRHDRRTISALGIRRHPTISAKQHHRYENCLPYDTAESYLISAHALNNSALFDRTTELLSATIHLSDIVSVSNNSSISRELPYLE